MRDLVIAFIFLVAIVVSLWLHFSAPCEVYKYTNTADIPGRCVMGGR